MELTVADMTFEGWGHSKRDARASAARTCLSALLARAGRVLPNPGPQPDFTSDEAPKYPVSEFQCIETKIQPPDGNGNKATPPPGLFGPAVSPVLKSPINMLYETYPGITFHCSFGDGSPLDTAQAPVTLSHSMRFKVVCQIKYQKFEGYGSSKKLAKLAAARAALGEMCEKTMSHARPVSSDGLPQLLADHVAKLVNEKFNEMMRGDLVHSKRKVLAGIVMTIDNKLEGAKVIAVTTGTKCVSGEHMSVRGRVVNDCHAELRVTKILMKIVNGSNARARARVSLLARGQLRTKIESGEGTIPVKNCINVIQTWDGVLQGERLLTMSCSDKAARWCVAGVQGALLARLLRPVYLRALVLGSLLHRHHMYRAICGRIEGCISALPPPYRLHRPLLARAASTEARTPARAPSFSVCWSITSPYPEIINATTGKLENGHPSLLCKQSMFARWQYLVRRLPLLPQDPAGPYLPPLPQDMDHLLYDEAKNLCSTYQVAKRCLTDAFEQAQLGRWIKKPIEQDQFHCEILGADPALLFA
nr:double-stranded RNA-specific editase Adar-like [Vanessa tameamea]XP_026494113.1 double-stranded RNA-specific editase Adar-like [Vanessa tameamea]